MSLHSWKCYTSISRTFLLASCLDHIRLGLFDHLTELAGLVQLDHDVAAADELTADVELRDGGPLAEILDALSDGLVAEHVDGVEIDLVALQDLGGRVGEAALREQLGALHEEQDGVALDEGLDAFLRDFGRLLEEVIGHGEGGRGRRRCGGRSRHHAVWCEGFGASHQVGAEEGEGDDGEEVAEHGAGLSRSIGTCLWLY
mmetsp:Transcript_22711/g.63386  ORF Transcript_22711/g.63386 Transcript_22711/m.63386 type:complete len:201 (+) Transcript_22711:304-906(+)